MKTSQAGIDLIKRFEGCKLKAYRLPGEKLWTCGYGHSGTDVLEGMTISQERADELLRLDLATRERYVEQYATIPLTQPMFDALVSYCYNRGVGKFREYCNASKTPEEYCSNLILMWGSAQRYKTALLKRRRAEQELFKSGMIQKASVHEIALEVLDGKWYNGQARKNALTQAGYDYAEVQAEVNRILKGGAK